MITSRLFLSSYSSAPLSASRRTFAYGRHWKLQPNQKKQRRRRYEKARRKRRPRPEESTLEALVRHPSMTRSGYDDLFESSAPPAFFRVTASPHVFCAATSDAKEWQRSPPLLTADRSKSSFGYLGTKKQLSDAVTDETNMVAFLGRSNVGKSSLLNALLREKLARTSKQPGRTQQAHFFEWTWGTVTSDARSDDDSGSSGKQRLGLLVDLPGYGYAVGPDHAVDQWQRRTQNLLMDYHSSQILRQVYLLVDARVGATPFDWSVVAWLQEGQFPFSLVLSKADAVSRAVLIKHVNHVCMRCVHMNQEEECTMSPTIHACSSKTGDGIDELLFGSILRNLVEDSDENETFQLD